MLLSDIVYTAPVSRSLRVLLPIGGLLFISGYFLIDTQALSEEEGLMAIGCLLLGVLGLVFGIVINIPNFFGAILTESSIYLTQWGRVRRIYLASIESIESQTVSGNTTIQLEYLSGDGSRTHKANIFWLSDMESLERKIYQLCEEASGQQWDKIEENTVYWFFDL